MIDMHPPPRILAIEPDPQSGTALYRALDKWVCADVVIVDNIDAALTSIAEQVPDLILTSTFLPPAALARLNDELRRLPDATHTLIITTPHLLDDAVLLGAQVEHYLAQCTVAARGGPGQAATGPGSDYRSGACRPPARSLAGFHRVTGTEDSDRTRPSGPEFPAAGRSAPGLTSPSRGSGRPMGTQAQSGRRRQNRGHLMLGRAPRDEHQAPAGEPDRSRGHRDGRQHCRRCPPDQDRDGRGRWSRCEIPRGRDVPARDRPVRTERQPHPGGRTPPRLTRQEPSPTCSPAFWRMPAGCRTAGGCGRLFESEVCALVGAKEVRIRALPVAAAGGCQSLYFRIPTAAESEHGLHVVFERGYRPTAAEFRLLKAAASLASVVLDLAPAGEEPTIN